MYPTWSLVIVVRPGHVPLRCTTVDDEQQLPSNLRTEEGSLIIPNLLPLRKVLGYLRSLDTRRRLAMTTRVHALRHHRLLLRVQLRVLRSQRSVEQGINTAANVWRLLTRLGRVGSRSYRR